MLYRVYRHAEETAIDLTDGFLIIAWNLVKIILLYLVGSAPFVLLSLYRKNWSWSLGAIAWIAIITLGALTSRPEGGQEDYYSSTSERRKKFIRIILRTSIILLCIFLFLYSAYRLFDDEKKASASDSLTEVWKQDKEQSAEVKVNPQPNQIPYGVDAHTVALWTFDQDEETLVKDSTGDHDGRSIGPTLTKPGLFGKVREFQRFDFGGFIQVPDSTKLNMSGTLSIELWVRPINFDLGLWNGQEGLVTKGGDWHIAGHSHYSLYITRNSGPGGSALTLENIRFGFEIARWQNSGANASSPHWHRPNQWYYVVGTYDGQRARIFVNGTLEAESLEAPGLSVYNDEPLFMNNHTFSEGHSQSQGRMGGLIDEVRISNIARTESEIAQTYGKSTVALQASGE